jgi:hypothetical protein
VDDGDVFVRRVTRVLLLVGPSACGGRAGSAPARVPPAKPADHALLRARSHKAEPMHAGDCTGRFCDIATCSQFVRGFDVNDWGALELPEAQLWKERLAAHEHMCGTPPPGSARAADLYPVCSQWGRDQVDEAYKKFLAQEAWQKAHR